MAAGPKGEKIVVTGGCHDCGGRCLFRVHVRDGVITRIETDDGEEPQLRACARGRAYRQRVYAADRLTSPLKRVGERGDGRFEPISWDEALDTVAGELIRVRDTHGPEATLLVAYFGSQGQLHAGRAMRRLLAMAGGCSITWGMISGEACTHAVLSTYGTGQMGNTRDDLLNSRLIVLWGWNPANTVWSTNTAWHLMKAREAGIPVTCVDPRFTDTTATLAQRWIPLRPGTDSAMMVAMAFVMITENLHDQRFLDTYTVGFQKFKDYVLGEGDRVPKTPEWAEAICGVPAQTIAGFAREYATTKPAALITGFSPGRSAFGEQYHRAAMTLAAMTGNVGIHGGNAAGSEISPVGSLFGHQLPVPPNPVDQKLPFKGSSLDTFAKAKQRVHIAQVWDALLRGRQGGYPTDYKLAYFTCVNYLNQFPNVNKGIEALKKTEFVVVHDTFLTPTARYADIVLPVNTFLERSDFYRPWMSGPYYIFGNQAIDPEHGTKSDFDIARELAPRLGVSDYSDKTEDEWLRDIFEHSSDMVRDIPDYDAFRRQGQHKFQTPGPLVAFEKEVRDPENNPFPTPSGKIEIFSQRLADIDSPLTPPIPSYIEPWEGPSDPLREKFPLQLITVHFKRRAHSTFDNTPWLRELEAQRVQIGTLDARERGIRDGDLVRVFNARGEMRIPAWVTERIMTGVVAIPEGAWYDPDENGVDLGGCVTVLSRDQISPGGAFPTNTALVQVTRA